MREIFLSHLLIVRSTILSLGASQSERYSYSLKDFVKGADSLDISVVANMVERHGELTITAYYSDSQVKSLTLSLVGDMVLSLLVLLRRHPAHISASILLNDMMQTGSLNYQL